jgi:hypothetical protein
MYKALRYFLYFTFGAVLSACSSYTAIHFEALRPAVYSVPPEIKSVVLVDNSIEFPDTMVNVILVNEEIVKVDTTKVPDYPKNVIKIVGGELSKRMFFDTVYVDTLRHKSFVRGKQTEELKPAQIDSICLKFGVDVIISLDAYRYTNNVSILNIADYEYYAAYDASAINFWRIYRCADHSVMNVHLQKDTIFWEGSGESMNGSVSSFPKFSDATHEIGSYLAYKYVDYLAPYWEEVTRRLYTNGNMNFQNATEWISKGNWKEAEKIWNYIYKNGSNYSKIKAAVNLAVAFERTGDIDNAIKWSYNAYRKMIEKPNVPARMRVYIMSYYNDLTVRKREKRKLVEQLGEF